MKALRKRIVTVMIVMFLASPVLPISGCGNDVADSQGCPSGSYLANATDTIIGPGDDTLTITSSPGFPYAGGASRYTPLVFTINDSSGVPRNNVCLTVYTDGFWYADANYETGTLITGTGPLNSRVVVTNDSGVVILYWTTEVLPAANPATIVPPATTLTAGQDIASDSFVQVYSGTLSDVFTVNWTVRGEPAP